MVSVQPVDTKLIVFCPPEIEHVPPTRGESYDTPGLRGVIYSKLASLSIVFLADSAELKDVSAFVDKCEHRDNLEYSSRWNRCDVGIKGVSRYAVSQGSRGCPKRLKTRVNYRI